MRSSASAARQPRPIAAPANNLPGVLSTLTLIVQAVGVVDVNWHTAADSARLNFFGLSSAAGVPYDRADTGETGRELSHERVTRLVERGALVRRSRQA